MNKTSKYILVMVWVAWFSINAKIALVQEINQQTEKMTTVRSQDLNMNIDQVNSREEYLGDFTSLNEEIIS